jgi:hypothetical protein
MGELHTPCGAFKSDRVRGVFLSSAASRVDRAAVLVINEYSFS